MSVLRVDCYAGYRGEEAPRRLILDGQKIEITEILGRWSEPDARLFRVRGDDGRVYVLRSDERTKRWDVPEVAG